MEPYKFPKPQPKQKKEKCKIVIKRKGDTTEKSIEGNCSPSQLSALSKQNNVEIEES
jgi:hypothetical protein